VIVTVAVDGRLGFLFGARTKRTFSSLLPQAVRRPRRSRAYLRHLHLIPALQIHRMRRKLIEGEELFRLITENAADMIAVVDMEGNRVFNSLSYEKVLGYSLDEAEKVVLLCSGPSEDIDRVRQAGEEAQRTGIGLPLEYRIRHKDGRWRVLESTASVIRNAKGEPENS